MDAGCGQYTVTVEGVESSVCCFYSLLALAVLVSYAIRPNVYNGCKLLQLRVASTYACLSCRIWTLLSYNLSLYESEIC